MNHQQVHISTPHTPHWQFFSHISLMFRGCTECGEFEVIQWDPPPPAISVTYVRTVSPDI